MPDYTWHTTEGQSFMEIVGGVQKKHTVFYSQKTSFKTGVPSLRPGAILTLTVAGRDGAAQARSRGAVPED